MKRNIIATLFLCHTFLALYSQGWTSSTATVATYIEPAYSTIFNNNLYVLSNFIDTVYSPIIDTAYGAADILLQKYDLTGNFKWSRNIGNDSADLARGIATDPDGNVYITGSFGRVCKFQNDGALTSTGSYDSFLAKYDPNGNLIWKKSICRGSGQQNTIDLIIDNQQNIVLIGYFKNKMIIGDPATNTDTLIGYSYYSPFISKFTMNGDLIWSKAIKTSAESYFRRVAFTENAYYLGGPFQGTIYLDVDTLTSLNSSQDIIIYKVDEDGKGQWVRRLYGTGVENFRSLETDEYENIYILGTFQSSTFYYDSTSLETNSIGNSGGHDSFIAKYNRTGNLQWFLKRASVSSDYFNDIAIHNNLIYATGYFTGQIKFGDITLNSSSPSNQDVFFVALNSIGDPIHAANIVGTGNYNDRGINVLIDNLSQAYIIGYYKSPSIQIGTKTYTNSHLNKPDQFIAIYQHPLKAVITDEQMVSCNGLSDGMLAVTPYFGRPPYTYSWSHESSLNAPVADNLAAGTYTVTITDANDSIASIAGVVTQAAALAIDSVITPVSCYNNGQDGAIDITVSGGTKKGDYSYYWTTINGNGIIPLNQDQTGLAAGTYTVQVKDANQCSITEDFTVLQPAPFNFSASDTTHIISPDIRKGSVDLEITGGNEPYDNFAWAGPDGFTASSEDIGNLDSVGIYTVTFTDSKGCIADTAFTILDNLIMFAEISAKTDVVCFGDNNGSATVTVHNGTPDYSYEWDDEATVRFASTRHNMEPGTYYVTVTDGTLKKSLPTKVVINSPSAPLTINLTSKDLRCANDNSGVINLTVSGGKTPYTYLWNNGYNGEDLVNVAAGAYTVTVTDKFGCTVQEGKTLAQPAGLWITPVISGSILCHGDRSVDVTANVSGGGPSPDFPHYDFVWDDPGTQTMPTAYDLGAGTYHITVTDTNQCSMTTAVTITEPDELSYTAVVTNPSCPELSDGSIVITPVGGTGPGYEFLWDNNIFTRFNTNIPAGRYILTLNDANFCTLVDTFFLADPEPLEIVSADITDVSCLGKSDGSITVNAQGGTGTIEYSSDNGVTFGTSNVLNSLTGGDYIVAIRDESNCTSVTLPVSVAVIDTVKATYNLTDATCLGIDNGSIAIDATRGSGVYEYSIDGGDSFSNEDSTGSLAAGDYVIVVTDDNDCLSEVIPVTLIALDTVKADQVTETDLTCAGINDGSIAVVASGGTGVYEYSVDGGTSFVTTSTIGSLAEGNYTVVVRDDEGCISESVAAALARPEVCGLVIYNAFSPDDNGKNDVWNIGNAGGFPTIEVKIFNIWGKEVFSSKGYAEPWDGTFNGNDLPAGTYYYVIDPGDGSDVLSGDVSIVK